MKRIKEKLSEFQYYIDQYRSGLISYEEYSEYFRRTENLIIQIIFLSVSLIAFVGFTGFPIYVCIVGILLIIYGAVLQKDAFTREQQTIRGTIWAVTSFVLISSVLISLSLLHLI